MPTSGAPPNPHSRPWTSCMSTDVVQVLGPLKKPRDSCLDGSVESSAELHTRSFRRQDLQRCVQASRCWELCHQGRHSIQSSDDASLHTSVRGGTKALRATSWNGKQKEQGNSARQVSHVQCNQSSTDSTLQQNRHWSIEGGPTKPCSRPTSQIKERRSLQRRQSGSTSSKTEI